jgi:hypothetical protein
VCESDDAWQFVVSGMSGVLRLADGGAARTTPEQTVMVS